jgi:cysteine desulfurase
MTCTSDRIYLDYAASTPVDTRVLEAMIPYMGNIFGNPSSVHTFGQLAETAVEGAREMVARILNIRIEVQITSSSAQLNTMPYLILLNSWQIFMASISSSYQ